MASLGACCGSPHANPVEIFLDIGNYAIDVYMINDPTEDSWQVTLPCTFPAVIGWVHFFDFQ